MRGSLALINDLSVRSDSRPQAFSAPPDQGWTWLGWAAFGIALWACLALACIAAPALLSGSALAQSTTQSSTWVAAQSACPDSMPDVDRIACFVSAYPGPVPAGQKSAPPLLRGSDGTTIIGPKPSR
jgi:hypothetical protein